MTWSILANNPETGEFGAAVASRFLATGALCMWGHGQYGVLATQALLNLLHGGRAVRLLGDDYSARDALVALLASDDGREERQVHIIDRNRNVAQHTGANCLNWCGSVSESAVSVAGNRLAGRSVIERSQEAFLASVDRPMAERLICALEAGEEAGGDLLGKQSAAIKVWHGEEYPILDLRVDDSSHPVSELWRLYELAKVHFIPYTKLFATRANPSGVLAGPDFERLYRSRR